MSSIYHILDKIPAISLDDEVQVEYENLAKQLVASGKLRIDTGYYCNFSPFSDNKARISVMFSLRELTESNLILTTKEKIKNLYQLSKEPPTSGKIDLIIEDLLKQLQKLLNVSPDLELKLARIFVQSAHPIVIKWLLLEGVEVFITYSNSIGDVMSMSSWKVAGTNSGMQSTDGRNGAIYISCGGDPFLENDKNNPRYGNGWAALARMQIISAQEIGHFADIKRDHTGRQISRHSANFACTQATPEYRQSRRNDINRCDDLYKKLLLGYMDKLLIWETKLKFYNDQKISGLKVFFIKLYIKYYRYRFFKFCAKNKLIFVRKFRRDKYTGLMIKTMIEDMKCNLAPVADVYKRDNPEAEEAISCVEAIARVPQQVMKWGYLTTKATMHDLYNLYYGEIIPSLIENYNYITNKHYHRNYSKIKLPLWRKIWHKANIFKSKKKFKFKEIRTP